MTVGLSVGIATSFTTGDPYPTNSGANPFMNNGYAPSPGSEHSNGANFGLADGSVTYLNTWINPQIFCLLGSMADRVSCSPPAREGSLL